MHYLQNITNSRSATAKLMIKMFVVDRIIGLAATTVNICCFNRKSCFVTILSLIGQGHLQHLMWNEIIIMTFYGVRNKRDNCVDECVK